MPEVVFLDFEASSLEKKSYPIEVAWVTTCGHEESHLIKPAPEWVDWSDEAEAIHKIRRERLIAEGMPHDELARRMVDVLSDRALYASAPSWDGQWLSKLLRAAGLPRHSLRLQDTEVLRKESAERILNALKIPDGERAEAVEKILLDAKLQNDRLVPAHRALADARRELQIWQDVCAKADAIVRTRSQGEERHTI
ncbi:transcriptional regulator [Microvirga sp. 2YAF29]|uniref:3'-5' exonuclease n=1 Tax=Microvirga sp. 2YAF29 TaxID=3233031 RepID=UPI003F973877